MAQRPARDVHFDGFFGSRNSATYGAIWGGMSKGRFSGWMFRFSAVRSMSKHREMPLYPCLGIFEPDRRIAMLVKGSGARLCERRLVVKAYRAERRADA